MYFAALSEPGEQIRLVVLVILAAIVGLYLVYLNRKKEPADTLAPFAKLDEARLNATPDGELLSTVIANLLSKMDPKRPDPYVTIPPLGEARCTVYCVWVYDRILQEDGVEALKKGKEALLVDFALDGFKTIGATRCAEAVAALFSDGATPEDALAAYRNAAAEEKPLEACVPYIRDNLPLFCDGE